MNYGQILPALKSMKFGVVPVRKPRRVASSVRGGNFDPKFGSWAGYPPRPKPGTVMQADSRIRGEAASPAESLGAVCGVFWPRRGTSIANTVSHVVRWFGTRPRKLLDYYPMRVAAILHRRVIRGTILP
jgi:hypothetical protein